MEVLEILGMVVTGIVLAAIGVLAAYYKPQIRISFPPTKCEVARVIIKVMQDRVYQAIRESCLSGPAIAETRDALTADMIRIRRSIKDAMREINDQDL